MAFNDPDICTVLDKRNLRSWVDPDGRKHICIDAFKIGNDYYIHTVAGYPDGVYPGLEWLALPEMHDSHYKWTEDHNAQDGGKLTWIYLEDYEKLKLMKEQPRDRIT